MAPALASLAGLLLLPALVSAHSLPFKSFSSDEGLAQSVVMAMAQDQEGYLWLGTPDGVSRFDGLVFDRIDRDVGLAGDVVRAITVDPAGVVWVGTDAGLSRFAGGGWQVLTLEDGLPAGGVRSIAPGPQGAVWVGTFEGGMARIDDAYSDQLRSAARIHPFTSADGLGEDRVRALHFDREGALWVGTFGGGLSRLHEGRLSTFGSAAGLDPFVRTLYETRDGDLLVGTNRGLFRRAGDRFERLGSPSPIDDDVLTAVLEDRRGRVWVGTRGHGACWLDGSDWLCYRASQGLADDSVTSLVEDREGNLWFGTFGGGVSRLSSESFNNYGEAEGLPHSNVSAITEAADGAVWLATHGGGVARLGSHDQVRVLSEEDGLPQRLVVSALNDPGAGELWFGTLAGAVRIDGERVSVLGVADGLPGPTVLDVARTPDGVIWFATTSGLAWRAGDGLHTLLVADGLPAERVNVVVPARDGGVWVGTAGGLSRVVDGELTTWTTRDGLPDDFVQGVLERSDGSLWIATAAGLSRYQFGVFRNYSRADGLPEDKCMALLEDRAGRLWVGTTRGIAVLDGERFAVFDSRDGLVSSEVNPAAGFVDAGGRLWFGTVRGAVVFDPEPRLPVAQPPAMVLTSFEVQDRQLLGAQQRRFSWRDDDLYFGFTGISLTYPGDVEYEYRLVGLDERWRISTARFARYVEVPPGDYTFEVRGRARGSEWSSEVLRLPLVITPPLWSTWWFRVGTLALVVGLAAGAHRRRLRLVEARSAELEGIVRQRERAEVAMRRYASELEHAQLHDRLTGLPNRALFRDRLSVALEESQQSRGLTCAVLALDIDNFKLINDSHGHQAGDGLLRECAQRLQGAVRLSDTVARLGGDDFTVLLRDVHGPLEASRIAEEVQRALAEPVEVDGHQLVVTASIGIATQGGEYQSADEILRDADTAMYRAKSRGRGQSALFDRVMHHHAVQQLRLETDLRGALERDELVLHYQPVRELASGRTRALEALLRWRHPTRGMLSPGDFLSHVHETGMGVAVGEWVLGEACRQAARWSQSLSIPPTVAVNLFPQQVAQLDLAQRVARMLAEQRLDPGCLAVEITEEVLVEDPTTAVVVLNRVRGLGLKVYLDDFGTGYSSLSYLERFPVDVLKIDRSFVPRLVRGDDRSRIVDAILYLARSLDISVIAEGVETEEQLERLRGMGCAFAQGYFIARPMPASAVEDFLAEEESALPSGGARRDRGTA